VGANRNDRRGKTGLLHPATMGCQGLGGRRTDGPATAEGLRQNLRLDPRESPRGARATGSRSLPISAAATPSTVPWLRFPRRTPTKTIGTTAR
jgi:hypothetical protein